MSFSDDLRESIRSAKAAKEAHTKAGWDFDTKWERMRESFRPLLQEAKKVFQEEGIDSGIELFNGSLVFSVGSISRTGKAKYQLTFRADNGRRVVICSSSLKSIEQETCTLDHLTESVFQSKVTRFAEEIFRGDAPRSELP